MKISRNSWHYRHLAELWDTDPTNLCWYFWKCVFTVLFIIGGGILLLMFGFLMIYLALWPVLQIWIWDPMARALSFCVWSAALYFIPYFYRMWLYDSGRLELPAPREPGLVHSYVRAKKDKVCPLIEYD